VSAAGHLDHLTDADLALLGEVTGGPAVSELRARPDRAVALLSDPRAFDALFTAGPGSPELMVRASPFLAFACLVERATQELATARSVAEPVGRRRWVPVFDADQLRAFAAPPAHRLFLAELLTSYTRVASGAVWVRGRRRWRRRRFSELDVGQLVGMLEVVAPAERPGVLRRLGDLALFLTGVFPDSCERRVTPASSTEQALQAAGIGGLGGAEHGSVPYLEVLGAQCYRQACASAAGLTASMAVVGEVADGFSRARRVLNFMTERHLFAERERWFGGPAT
jgi:hypothetical protein